MTPEQFKALRAPFPPEKIGKLPRVTCGPCRDSRERNCGQHSKSKCPDCAAWITSAHIHLDFVGHADVTDRMLEVDPDWTWEPFALDAKGLPAFDDNGGMWIRLTVCGTTRIGYGDADGKKGANAVKETIGDALRNAGQRFGIALDLWRKEAVVEESRTRRREEPAPETPTPAQAAKHAELVESVKAASSEDALRIGWGYVNDAFKAGQLTPAQANGLRRLITGRRERLTPPGAMTGRTRKELFVLLHQHDYREPDEYHAFAETHLPREVLSMSSLTEDEAQTLIGVLRRKAKETPPPYPPAGPDHPIVQAARAAGVEMPA